MNEHLLKSGNDPVLTWERRVKILRDCALALRYLHHYIDGCIVHRDIKVKLTVENRFPHTLFLYWHISLFLSLNCLLIYST